MNVRLTQWLFTCLFISCISCSKEISKEIHQNPGGIQTSGDFSASIGSVQWNADSIQLIQVSNGGVSINGISKTGEQISIILPSFKIGVYSLNAQSSSYALYANLLSTTPTVYISNQANGSGTVTINSIDTVKKLVSGSFLLNLVNPGDNSVTTITKGIFTLISYSGSAGVVVITPPGTADTLTASVSGFGAFNATQVIVTDQQGIFDIDGVSSGGLQSIDLLMPDNINPGSYTLNFAGGQYVAAYVPSNFDPLVSTQGTLTIITNDPAGKRIKGSFEFTGSSQTTSSSVAVSKGFFSVNY